MMNIKTVNQVDSKSIFSEKAGEEEKAERFGPQVIGREVIDPGVYKDQGRFHKQEIKSERGFSL